jgi:methylthioribose-1-phosphate isomerase
MLTLEWADGAVRMIDQTRLPGELIHVDARTVDELIDAIQRLVVRGAPALGVAGALGVALAATLHDDLATVNAEANRIAQARPTAVNLAWGVEQVRPFIGDGPAAVLAKANEVLAFDIEANRTLGYRGAHWLIERLRPAGDDRPINVQTHCNAGGLACVEWGTALGVVRALHELGRLGKVYADETRPLLQGARLTAWELDQMGVDHCVVVDGAGATVIARGMVDCVVIGSDRIAANGDVCNKIGSFPLALAAQRAGVPFMVAAPESTVDMATVSGSDIDIEERDGAEISDWGGRRITPARSPSLNLAFDVTPNDLVTVIVTETREVHPAAGESL